MRIVVHDYAGHPFQFALSRALAGRGHIVKHIFFADDPGPKGVSSIGPDDPADLTISPITLRTRGRKDQFLRRVVIDHLYGRRVYRDIRNFQPDVVISGNTPLDAQRAVWRAARDCGGRFVFWVQDFIGIGIERILSGRWMGLGRAIARYYRGMETRLLRKSDAIVLISPDFQRYLPPSLARRDHVRVVRNWGTLSATSATNGGSWAARQGVSGKFVFMYTGTLALKHNPGLLLALADAFADDAVVQVVVVAAGVNAGALAAMNAVHPRKNLSLLPLQPATEMADVLGTASVLVALLESDAAEFSVPSKLLSYLCAGRPILLSAPTQNLASQVLEESGAGLAASASDTEGFLAAARKLRQSSVLRQTLADAGRDYAECHFKIDTIASRFEEVFEVACATNAAAAR